MNIGVNSGARNPGQIIKNNLTVKQLLLYVSMLVTVSGAFAGVGEMSIVTTPKFKTGGMEAGAQIIPPVSIKDAVPSSYATEEGKYTLTFSIERNEEMTTMPVIRVVGKDTQETVLKDYAAGNWHIDLEEGEYVILSYVQMGGGRMGFYVKDVMLKGNMEIYASVTDVKNAVSFKSFNPDGSDTKLPGIKESPDSETGDEFVDGNINMLIAQSSIWHKKFGHIAGSSYVISDTYYRSDGKADADKLMSFATNDLTDDFSVCHVRFMTANDGFYLAASEPIVGLKENKEFVLGRHYNPQPYEPHFVLSPKGLESQSQLDISENLGHYNADLVIYDGLKLYPIAASGMNEGASSPKSHIFIDENTKSLPISVGARITAYDVYERIDENTAMVTGKIVSQPTILNSDSPEVRFRNFIQKYRVEDDPMAEPFQPKGHPGFSFLEKDAINLPGDNVPSVMIVSAISYNTETQETTRVMVPVLTGRVGESMMAYPTTTLKDEGKTITVEDANRIIEGIEGRVCARFEFVDEKLRYAPQLVQLQFRSADGKVTDRFNQSGDGIVRLAAADFNPNFDDMGDVANYSIGPVDLKIEYSPNGNDDWAEFEITEKPDLYFEPGYGHFYESSLKCVDKPSANKWYDLRISISDPDGNSNVQTISPAFRIDSLSSLESIDASDIMDGDCVYYNTMGVRVDRPEKGQLLIRVNNGRASKIIVK